MHTGDGSTTKTILAKIAMKMDGTLAYVLILLRVLIIVRFKGLLSLSMLPTTA